MDGSGSQRVVGDQGDCLDSPANVEGGQASHAPPIHQQEPAMGGTMDILQQIAQDCKKQCNQLQLLLNDQQSSEWQGTDR